MPSKFVVRNLRENGIYHIYNRSTHTQGLFLEAQDYRVFLFYLYIYTHPIEKVIQRYSDLPKRLRDKSLADEIEIIAVCLLPDHFHLLVKQHQANTISRLMKQIVNGYTMYYNQKYLRVGPVMQGRYKSVEVDKERLADMARYVHLHPLLAKSAPSLGDYPWSSYKKYLGEESTVSCDIELLMDIFGTQEKLIAFHSDMADYTSSLPKIRGLTIE